MQTEKCVDFAAEKAITFDDISLTKPLKKLNKSNLICFNDS